MARSQLTVQPTSANNGITPLTFEAANVDGNSISNNGKRIALVRNGDTVDHTVTQATGGTVSGLAVSDPAVTVPAGGMAVLGPWPPVFNQPAERVVHLDYDAVTSVEVAAVEC